MGISIFVCLVLFLMLFFSILPFVSVLGLVGGIIFGGIVVVGIYFCCFAFLHYCFNGPDPQKIINIKNSEYDISFNYDKECFNVKRGKKTDSSNYYFNNILMVSTFENGIVKNRYRKVFGVDFNEQYENNQTGVRIYYSKPDYFIELKTKDKGFLNKIYKEVVSIIKKYS